MKKLQECLELISSEMETFRKEISDHELYKPIDYLLSLGGKRLRPALALLSARAFGDESKASLKPALGLEVFHNFTLMHDDIMDEAPLRRGKATVHELWNTNAAILSGDAMMVMAYQLITECPPDKLRQVLDLFSKTALEVCEGQQMDMDFEQREDVSLEEYLEMIRLKTSVLLAASLEVGALIAGATEPQAQAIYTFGLKLGIAFQLRDDYLDAFGDEEKLGKQIGGDILADKKTFLLIYAMQEAKADEKKELLSLISNPTVDPKHKIERVKAIMIESGADKALLEKSGIYYEESLLAMKSLNLENIYLDELRQFAAGLMQREH